MFEAKNLNVDLIQGDKMLPVVRSVSFVIEPGKLLGLIGESGSGKTVTGMSVMGVQRAPNWKVEGEVLLNEKQLPLDDEKQLRLLRGQDISIIMQNPMSAFDPLFTIREHFRETRASHNERDKNKSDRIAEELLERMHIAEPKRVLKSYPFECSGGMLQRIMIAIAIMNKPDLLIADEPTTALDRTVQYEIIRLMGELKADGSSILFISHDLKAVSYIADEIAVMYGGYIIEKGPTELITRQPLHPYTKALIGATPTFSKEKLPVLKGVPPSLQQRPKIGCPFAPRCPVKQDGCESFDMQAVIRDGRECRCKLTRS